MDRPLPSSLASSSRDTSCEARRVQVECYRRMESWQKVAAVLELNDLSDALALAGLADRHPEANDEELRMRLFALKQGAELARQAYGWSAGD